MNQAMQAGALDLLESIRLSPLAMVVTDPRQADNPIVAANPAFCRLTQFGEGEVIGRNCRFLVGPGTEPVASARLGEAVRACMPVVVELTNYRRDGSSFLNAVMIAPWYDEAGALRYFVGSQMECDPASPGRQRAARMIARLTPRQGDVLRLMAAGLRNKQIAARLGISEKTVKMHRAYLLTRLEVGNSVEAVRIAVEAGL